MLFSAISVTAGFAAGSLVSRCNRNLFGERSSPASGAGGGGGARPELLDAEGNELPVAVRPPPATVPTPALPTYAPASVLPR